MRDEHLRVWFAPEEMKAGQKIHEQIDQAIRVYDKLLLIISNSSMKSEWGETEMYHTRQREKEQQRRMLFPIRLVDFDSVKEWKCMDADTGRDMAREIREYFIPDFSNWKDHDAFDWMRLPFNEPGVILQLIRIVAEAVRPLAASSARVLPLSLGWQSALEVIGKFSRHVVALGKSIAKMHRFVPSHRLDRQVRSRLLEPTWVLSHDLLVLCLGHFVFAQIKPLRQCHLMLSLPVESAWFILRTSHHECVWLDPNVLRKVYGCRVWQLLGFSVRRIKTASAAVKRETDH